MTRHSSNEKGVVSILVTMIMMTVITVIVLSYSQIIRHEQRQTLDRQLNSQAYYSAESAINGVNAALDAAIANATSIDSLKKPTCSSPMPAAFSPYSSSFFTGDNALTCLMVDTASEDLLYGPIGVEASQIATMNIDAASAPMSQLQIEWQDDSAASQSAAPGGVTTLPPSSGWGANWPALLRFEIVPIPAVLSQDNLLANQMVFFLYPGPGVSRSIAASSGTNGTVVQGACDSSHSPRPFCIITLTGLSGSSFYMRIKPMYRPATVTITPQTGAGGPVTINGGQIIVDATAKSQDVLKRISIRRSVSSSYLAPDFVLDSGEGICKRISTSPTGTSDTTCGIN